MAETYTSHIRHAPAQALLLWMEKQRTQAASDRLIHLLPLLLFVFLLLVSEASSPGHWRPAVSHASHVCAVALLYCHPAEPACSKQLGNEVATILF